MELISPSDIAYVLALIKNGKGVWDQDVRMAANPHRGGEKKLCPLFKVVRVRKDCSERVCGRWRDWNTSTQRRGIGRRYTQQQLFSILCSEWEHWEPADEKLKNPVRTHWMEDDEVDKLGEEGGDEKEWWDKDGEEGYTSECDHVD